jgi:hypothetical protein
MAGDVTYDVTDGYSLTAAVCACGDHCQADGALCAVCADELRAQLSEAREAIRDLLDGARITAANITRYYMCSTSIAPANVIDAWNAKLARLRKVIE